MPTILVVDDEKQIRRALRNALGGDQTRVVEAATGSEALTLAAAERPDVIVLDIGLPDIPGDEVCRQLRSWSQSPIIVLSARHSDAEKVRLFDLGADDYVTKPFSTAELLARVRAHLRRSAARQPAASIDAGDLRIDLAKPAVSRNGAAVHLTKTEWDVLRALLSNRGRTMTHRQLYTAVWGNAFGDAAQNLRVHIRSLRTKLEKDPVRPELIITEPGVGYRWESGE